MQITENPTYIEYVLSIILFNLYVYVSLLISVFTVLFFFDLKYMKSLNELKYASYLNPLTLCMILNLLSFAGIPPLFGFSGKFVLFSYILTRISAALVSFLVTFNFFSLFFYLQNVRFLAAKYVRMYFNIKNNFILWDKTLSKWLMNFNILNVFGFIVIEDLIAFFNNIFSFVY